MPKKNYQKNHFRKYKVNIKLLFLVTLIILFLSSFATKDTLVPIMIVNSIIVIIYIYIAISNERKNRKLYNVAYQDSLTGLGNELYFKENSKEYLNLPVDNKYILSIDIKKFKSFNNIYGHDFCDKIIKEFTEKLISCLPENNITCRLYSDVFISMFSLNENIRILLDKIVKAVSDLTIDDQDIHITPSLGICRIKPDEKDINKLIDKANIARYKIKSSFYDNYYIFDEKLDKELTEEQDIELSMESALKNGEFKVIYQPKFYVNDEKLYGAEALVRWYRGNEIISPAKFIPLFEKDKFILKLDLYVFEQTCKDMAAWKKEYGFTPTVSINVSKEHFINPDFIDEYIEISDKYGIERDKIDLEITESATVDNTIDIISIIDLIKSKGFIISLDDFGTGYSSLGILQDMNIDIIKIDKTFIDNVDVTRDNNIFNYIVLISKCLGVKIIVEGVETKEQLDFIKKYECDIVQGYYYSKPIPKEEFENYLKNADTL